MSDQPTTWDHLIEKIEQLEADLKLQVQDNERIIQSSKGAVDRMEAERDEMEVLIGQYRDGLTHDEIQRLHKLEGENAGWKQAIVLANEKLTASEAEIATSEKIIKQYRQKLNAAEKERDQLMTDNGEIAIIFGKQLDEADAKLAASEKARKDAEVLGDIDIRFNLLGGGDCPEWLKKHIGSDDFTLYLSDFDVPDGESRWLRITREGDGPTKLFTSPSTAWPEPDEWEEKEIGNR